MGALVVQHVVEALGLHQAALAHLAQRTSVDTAPGVEVQLGMLTTRGVGHPRGPVEQVGEREAVARPHQRLEVTLRGLVHHIEGRGADVPGGGPSRHGPSCVNRVRPPNQGVVSQLSRLLDANLGYAAARANVADGKPGRHLAVVTCMDARIDVFAVLGLHLGEALVIRNAGGRVTEDVLRSLALGGHVLGVDTVVVMQHTKCGLSGVTDEALQELTGAQLGFLSIDNHEAALREDVDRLAQTPFLGPLQTIAGFIYDVETGEITDVVRWERPA